LAGATKRPSLPQEAHRSSNGTATGKQYEWQSDGLPIAAPGTFEEGTFEEGQFEEGQFEEGQFEKDRVEEREVA
jgi:hypothetical protein